MSTWHEDSDATWPDKDGDDYIEDVKCLAETAKALLVLIDGEKKWVPKSVVGKLSEVKKKDDEGVLIIAQWFAEKEGLV